MTMRERVEDLRRRRSRIAEMGGPEALARQRAAGKLTARERIDRLFDADSFVELGARWPRSPW